VNAERPLPKQTDVLIIGAGIVGVTAAWQLARQGVQCVLLEKGRIGAEQSTRNWGWIRMQGRSAAEVPLMKVSQQIWRELDELSGHSFGFRQIGCTYLAESEHELAERTAFMQTAQEFELSTQQLTATQVSKMFGDTLSPTVGAIHTPTDCCAEPQLAMPAIAALASDAGVQIYENSAVRSLDLHSGKISGVNTEHGQIRCERVLLAAGAWSRTFLENEGLSLAQLAVKASVFRTEPVDLQFSSAMGTSNVAIRPRADGGVTVGKTGASSFQIVPAAFTHFRNFFPLLKNGPRTTALRVGKEFFGPLGRSRWHADQISPFEKYRILNPQPAPTLISDMARGARETFKPLRNLKIAEQWAGMIDVTPDELPVIDRVAPCDGLFIATGFSGHGFGLGPGAGALASSLLQGQTPLVENAEFAFGRSFGS
jgi:glycine/D-amino acid oxidase-like deaminating enzyme